MAQHVLPPRATELCDHLDQASTSDALNGSRLSLGEPRSELNGTRLQYAQGQCEYSGPGLELPTTGVDHHPLRRPVDRRDGSAEADSVSKRTADLLPQSAVAIDQHEIGVPRPGNAADGVSQPIPKMPDLGGVPSAKLFGWDSRRYTQEYLRRLQQSTG